ncbi:conserved hypothetical protein [Neospora caninum Liverpool]|uniref:Uncharacterized protein n=1 Tax=Neospora caninum (strain Liverpool) TaxID=572307 RepID=F0VBM0_NEOCL|nr:conserved hypothetical protein [Neospora caninum Liverpool]CBZ51004.1 conserved hypothetical protein [Neospora caninum Liverpool]|eukprot:XP_003881037.1 conserved hypothetical protein [Neospora caninum Liverpool]
MIAADWRINAFGNCRRFLFLAAQAGSNDEFQSFLVHANSRQPRQKGNGRLESRNATSFACGAGGTAGMCARRFEEDKPKNVRQRHTASSSSSQARVCRGQPSDASGSFTFRAERSTPSESRGSASPRGETFSQRAPFVQADSRGDWGSETGRGANENLRLWKGAHSCTVELRHALLRQRLQDRNKTRSDQGKHSVSWDDADLQRLGCLQGSGKTDAGVSSAISGGVERQELTCEDSRRGADAATAGANFAGRSAVGKADWKPANLSHGDVGEDQHRLLSRLAQSIQHLPTRDIAFCLAHLHKLSPPDAQAHVFSADPILAVYAAAVQALRARLAALSSLEWKDILVPVVDLLLDHPLPRSSRLQQGPPSPRSFPSSVSSRFPPLFVIFDPLLRDVCVRVTRYAPSLPPHLLLFFFNAYARISIFSPPLVLATAKAVERRIDTLSPQDVSMAVTTFALAQRQRNESLRPVQSAAEKRGGRLRPGRTREPEPCLSDGDTANTNELSQSLPESSAPSPSVASLPESSSTCVSASAPAPASDHPPSCASSPGLSSAPSPHLLSHSPRDGGGTDWTGGALPDVSSTFFRLLSRLATTPCLRQQLPLSSAVQILSACARFPAPLESRRLKGDSRQACADSLADGDTSTRSPHSSSPSLTAEAVRGRRTHPPKLDQLEDANRDAMHPGPPTMLSSSSAPSSVTNCNSQNSAPPREADVQASVFQTLFADVLMLSAFESWTPQLVASAMNAFTSCKSLSSFRRHDSLVLLLHRLLFTIRARRQQVGRSEFVEGAGNQTRHHVEREGLTAEAIEQRCVGVRSVGYKHDARRPAGDWRVWDDAFSDEKIVVSFSLALHALGKENVRLSYPVLTEVLQTVAWVLRHCRASIPAADRQSTGHATVRHESRAEAPFLKGEARDGAGLPGACVGDEKSLYNPQQQPGLPLSREWALMAWGLAKLLSYAKATKKPPGWLRGTATESETASSDRVPRAGSTECLDTWEMEDAWDGYCANVFRPLFLSMPPLLSAQRKPDVIAISQLADALRRMLLLDVGEKARTGVPAPDTQASPFPESEDKTQSHVRLPSTSCPVLDSHVPGRAAALLEGPTAVHRETSETRPRGVLLCDKENVFVTGGRSTDLSRRGTRPVATERGVATHDVVVDADGLARKVDSSSQQGGSCGRPGGLSGETVGSRERRDTAAVVGDRPALSLRWVGREGSGRLGAMENAQLDGSPYLCEQRLMKPEELLFLLRFVAGYLVRRADACKPHQLLQTSWLYIQLNLLHALQRDFTASASAVAGLSSAPSGQSSESIDPSAGRGKGPSSQAHKPSTETPGCGVGVDAPRMDTIPKLAAVEFMGCVLDRLRETESVLDEGNSFFLQQMLRAYVLKYPEIMKRHPKRIRKFVKRRLGDTLEKGTDSSSEDSCVRRGNSSAGAAARAQVLHLT